jgi:hypothetical protein
MNELVIFHSNDNCSLMKIEYSKIKNFIYDTKINKLIYMTKKFADLLCAYISISIVVRHVTISDSISQFFPNKKEIYINIQRQRCI